MAYGRKILKSLNSVHANLLELIKASLFGLTPNLHGNVDWEKILESAKAQCIVPLVSSHVPNEFRNAWIGISCQCKAHYMQILYEQNFLVDLLKTNNIPFFIFKGTAAAVYYPIPSLRTFGDIDFYVPQDCFDCARNILEHNGYIFIENNDRHFEYIKNGIVFELHSKISCDRYNDIERYIIFGYKNAVQYTLDKFSFPGLPTSENGLVLLGHIMQHLKASGIGLRQIIDWMMFVHNELDDSEWTKNFRCLACDAGLEKLAITVTYMCKKWLGLPDDISWCNGVDEDIAYQLLIRILDEGNFGNDRAPTESVKKSIKKIGLFKYLQTAGISNWPLAQKYVVFRPFAWLFQIFRFSFRGIWELINGKKVLSKGKHSMSLEELCEILEE